MKNSQYKKSLYKIQINHNSLKTDKYDDAESQILSYELSSNSIFINYKASETFLFNNFNKLQ